MGTLSAPPRPQVTILLWSQGSGTLPHSDLIHTWQGSNQPPLSSSWVPSVPGLGDWCPQSKSTKEPVTAQTDTAQCLTQIRSPRQQGCWIHLPHVTREEPEAHSWLLPQAIGSGVGEPGLSQVCLETGSRGSVVLIPQHQDLRVLPTELSGRGPHRGPGCPERGQT